jgi:hypothetical protein
MKAHHALGIGLICIGIVVAVGVYTLPPYLRAHADAEARFALLREQDAVMQAMAETIAECNAALRKAGVTFNHRQED